MTESCSPQSGFYNREGYHTIKETKMAPGERLEAMRAIKDFYIAHNAVVMGDIVLSPGVNIWFSSVLRGDLARIFLGPRVNLQDGCMVHTDTDAPQTIEEGAVIGHGAILHGRLVGRDGKITEGRYVVVWKRTNGEWKLHRDIWNTE